MYNIIVNPLSGGGKKKKIVEKVEKRLQESGKEYRFFETEKRGQAAFIAHELTSEGGCDLIVVGGDGTLHEALNGIADFENCNLGLVPAGTGNDFAAHRRNPPISCRWKGCAASTSSVRASTWRY